MFQISKIIKNRKTTGARSKRAELVGLFVEELNQERGSGYFKDNKWHKLQKLTPQAVAIKVRHLKELDDLRFFYSRCNQAKLEGRSFAKTFFGSLKVK